MKTEEREERYYDPAGKIYVKPSCHGEECAGNGKNEEIECCCDECDYYLLCFPDWKEFVK